MASALSPVQDTVASLACPAMSTRLSLTHFEGSPDYSDNVSRVTSLPPAGASMVPVTPQTKPKPLGLAFKALYKHPWPPCPILTRPGASPHRPVAPTRPTAALPPCLPLQLRRSCRKLLLTVPLGRLSEPRQDPGRVSKWWPRPASSSRSSQSPAQSRAQQPGPGTLRARPLRALCSPWAARPGPSPPPPSPGCRDQPGISS